MVPSGWLGDELMFHDWSGVDAVWKTGACYNISIVDNVLVSTENGLNKYQGILSIPQNQLTACCIQAGGDTHRCSKDLTREALQVVHWTIDASLIPSHEHDSFSMVLLEKVKFQGIDLYTNVFHEDTCEFQWQNASGEPANESFQALHITSRSRSCSNHSLVVLSGTNGGGLTTVDGVGHSRQVVVPDASAATLTRKRPREDVSSPMQVKVLTFHVDTMASSVYPKCMDNEVQDWSMVELFAGGLAGWKQAVIAMNNQGMRWESTHAVELVQDIAEAYCASYHIDHVFSASHEACQGPYMSLDGDSSLSTMFVGDVKDFTWIKCTPWQRRLLVAISSPCPPWSRASDRDGLHDLDGRLIIHAISALRFLTPEVVTMENVDTFRQHKHFKCVMDTMKWAGYRMAWESLSDLRRLAPIARRRWLAIFVRNESPIQKQLSFDFVTMSHVNLESFQVSIELPPEHEQDLTLDRPTLAIYSDVRFATQAMRCKHFRENGSLSSSDLLQQRVKTGRTVLSTVVALYGSQHKLPERTIKEKGIFAELTKGSFGVRFWSPFEIAIGHGLFASVKLPPNNALSHLIVGNSIAPPHALLTLTEARRLVDAKVNLNPQEVVLKAMLNRLHAGNAFITTHYGPTKCYYVILEMEPIILSDVSDDDPIEEVNPTGEATMSFEIPQEDVEIPATEVFQAGYQIQCTYPDSIHVYVVDGDTTVEKMLSDNMRSYAIDMLAVDQDGRSVPATFFQAKPRHETGFQIRGKVRSRLGPSKISMEVLGSWSGSC